MEDRVVIFTSPGCGPCEEVERRVTGGHIGDTPVELVSIEDDDGFERFIEEHRKSGSDTFGVPSAFHDGRQCDINLLPGNELSLDCS